jgi:acyl-CoA synthetase (NDP forming)
VRNPIDLTALADDAMTVATLKAVLEDDGVDMVLCATLFAPSGISDRLIPEIAAVAAGTKKPIILVAQFGPFTDGLLQRFHDSRVIGFPSVFRSVRALRFLVQRANALACSGGMS